MSGQSAKITNKFDNVARLINTALVNSSGTTLNSHGYTYNTASQRTQQTRTDASYVNYTYDNDGQDLTAVGSGGQSTENLSYVYDAAWNLNQRTSAGVPTTFGVDSQNQLTSGPGGTYGYDGNGNLTSSSASLISYSYDDENELTSVSAFQNWRTDLVYDGLARLRIRKEYTWNSSLGQWQQNSETHYLYDGRLVIQERDGSNNPTVSYTRGNDLGGSLQGAGGIGGLLARTASGASAFYHVDGNGNVTSMVDGSQTVVASYRYDPFGRIIVQSGSLASANAYRFSSKEFLSTSSMYYYGYRLYDPNLQRWINRDPAGEKWDLNLYRYAYNNPINWFDTDGLEPVSHTHYQKGNVMVHSEVPVPNGGQGGVHIQVGDVKFHFNTQTGGFGNLPKDLARHLQQDKAFRRAIENACRRVNGQGGFAPRYGGGSGTFVPLLAAILTLAQGSALAADIDTTARDYLYGLQNGEDVSAEAALLRNYFNSLAPLSGEVAFPVLLK